MARQDKGKQIGIDIVNYYVMCFKMANNAGKELTKSYKDFVLDKYQKAVKEISRLPKKQHDIAFSYVEGYSLLQELCLLTLTSLAVFERYYLAALRDIENKYNAEVFYRLTEQASDRLEPIALAFMKKDLKKRWTDNFVALSELCKEGKQDETKGTQTPLALAGIEWAKYENYQLFLKMFSEYMDYEDYNIFDLQQKYYDGCMSLRKEYESVYSAYMDLLSDETDHAARKVLEEKYVPFNFSEYDSWDKTAPATKALEIVKNNMGAIKDNQTEITFALRNEI